MIFSTPFVNVWMGRESSSIGAHSAPVETTPPQVGILTAFFGFLYFLMATQDIAVDAWALTMLSRENVGYASMCNCVGQSFGIFLANQGFIALSDPTWCSRYLSMGPGESLINLAGFMRVRDTNELTCRLLPHCLLVPHCYLANL
jgi:PAT family acetyl-CoA transporter-like MFS transporter 1